MTRSLFVILFSLLFIALVSSSSSDDFSKAFFKGIISKGLGNSSWSDPIVNFVNSSNFNISNLMAASNILLKNSQSGSSDNNLQALAQITITFNSLLNALFPLVAFSLRFDGIIRLIPDNYRPVFNVLNQTFATYANEKNLPSILRHVSQMHLLLQYSTTAQFFLAGQSFEDLTEKVSFGGFLNLQIDIDLSNASSIIEELYHADELLVGLLTGLADEQTISEGLLTHINNSNFDQHKILGSFNILSQINFSFPSNGRDEEEFTENIGSIALYLKNARDIAQQYGNQDAVNALTTAFNLFDQHSNLLGSIRVAISQQIDLQGYFKKIYHDGEKNGNYEAAGNTWATVCRILSNRNNRLSGTKNNIFLLLK